MKVAGIGGHVFIDVEDGKRDVATLTFEITDGAIVDDHFDMDANQLEVLETQARAARLAILARERALPR